MYKGRLFTFGCSFTHWNWPTWADLLGQEFEEHYNYATAGAGNLYIACNLAETIARHDINKNDTVMIMWSNSTREDRYVNSWVCPGNIHSYPETKENPYSKKFIRDFITIRGCYVRDLALMQLADTLLQGLGSKYHFMSMVDIEFSGQFNYQDDSDSIKDLLVLYKDTLSKFKPSVHSVIFNKDWHSRPWIEGESTRPDTHPLPLEHMEYINKVLPEYKFSDWTVEFAKKYDQQAKEIYRANPNEPIHVWDFHEEKRVPNSRAPEI